MSELKRKTINGIEMISGDGVNWGMAKLSPLITPLQALIRARKFDPPVIVKRPMPQKKIVVKRRRSKRLMNAPVMTLRKREQQKMLAALKRDAEAPRCEALKPPDKPPKPHIIASNDLSLVHSYSDVYTHIEREWFTPKPLLGIASKSVLESVRALNAKREAKR